MNVSLGVPRTRSARKSRLQLISFVSGWILLYALNGKFWDWSLFTVLGLARASKVGDSIHFFFYDSIKIVLLLVGITFAITIIRSFLTLDRTRAFLGGKKQGLGNMLAASAGIITPFCSCSAVPVFIGFLGAGIPIGITMSFLIASPLINEIAVGLLFTMFGWKIAAVYLFSGLAIAIVAGMVLGRMKVERWVEPFVYQTKFNSQVGNIQPHFSLGDRLELGVTEAKSILRKVWPYLAVGIALGALIHGWVPTTFFARYAGPENPLAVLLAVAIGIPLYSNAAGVMPMVQVLYDKGVPMGTLLSFMMAVVALSLPEMILLRRVLKPKLLAAFILVVGSGIIFVGYLFNAILK